MAQSKEGAKKAAQTMLKNNPDHFKQLAKKAHDAYNAQHKDERKKRGFAARPDVLKKVVEDRKKRL